MDGNSIVKLELRLIISLFLGGVVYAKAEYMAVFGMAIGLNLVDILMRLIMMEKLTAAKYKPAEDVTQANGFYGTFTGQQPDNEQPDHEHANGMLYSTLRKPQSDSDNTPLQVKGPRCHREGRVRCRKYSSY